MLLLIQFSLFFKIQWSNAVVVSSLRPQELISKKTAVHTHTKKYSISFVLHLRYAVYDSSLPKDSLVLVCYYPQMKTEEITTKGIIFQVRAQPYLHYLLMSFLDGFCSHLWIAIYSYVVRGSPCPHETIVLCQLHWNDFHIAMMYITGEGIRI